MNPNLEPAKQQIREQRYEDALQTLRTLDSQGAANAETHYLIGSIFHRQNELSEAVESFKRSLLLDPSFTDAAISLSIIYNDTGHYQEGRAIFEQAEKSLINRGSSAQSSTSIVVAKELAGKHLELGQLYRKLQRFDEAASEFAKAARLDNSNFEARIELAKTHAQRGNSELAESELTELAKDAPNNINVKIQLALLHYARGNTIDAQIELNEALVQDPANKTVRTYLNLTKQASESIL
jgi:tetratricopeptide (TPR) repeat protein